MIRIRSLEITDFKNVEHGRVVLSNVSSIEEIGNGAEVIGLYGQNGSGKTSFIEALSILKTLMCGKRLQDPSSAFIRKGRDAMKIKVEFFAAIGDDGPVCDYITGVSEEEPSFVPYLAIYETVVSKDTHDSPQVRFESLSCKDLSAGESMHEVFSWSSSEVERIGNNEQGAVFGISNILSKLADDATDQWAYELSPISPITHWQSLMAIDKTLASKLEAARNQAFQEGASFLFSSGLVAFSRDVLAKGGRRISRAAKSALPRVCIPAFQMAMACRMFATKDMVVLPTAHQGVLPLGYLPFASHEGERGDYVDNFMLLDIKSPGPIDARQVDELERALENVSEVIGELVPGLRVEVERHGTFTGRNGKPMVNIELMSARGSTKVPLRYESEGIKKVLSLISLLIDVHTNPATFVAIDELDSGVFEYLLGEILQTLSEHGYGQMVFTAHNLRPLEVLGSNSIWFTTVRPDRRYAKATGVHGSNNLRKMYLRDIRLGSDGDDVYVPTSLLRIDSALYDAGEIVRKMRRTQRG